MGNDSNPKQLAGTATTTFGSVLLMGVTINKVLTGTVVIKEGTSTVGTIAASTAAGDYHNIPSGVRYSSLSIVLSAGDDVTAFTRVA